MNVLRKPLPRFAALFLALSLLSASAAPRPSARVYYNRPPEANGLDTGLVKAIESADSTLDASYYNINNRTYSDALIAAKKRGVKVRIVAEDESYEDARNGGVYKSLEKAGIPIVLDHASHIMHHKFMVVDGERVWTGAGNMSVGGTFSDLNDSMLLESRGLASAFTTEFEEQFVNKRFGTKKTSPGAHEFTISGRRVELYFGPQGNIQEKILNAIAQAKHRIQFAMFSFTDMKIARAMIDKAKQGVKVEGVFDAEQSAGVRAPVFQLMKKAGLAVVKDRFPGKMHHKLVLIDQGTKDATVIAGSFNFSKAANEKNDETTLILHDPKVADQYFVRYQEVWEASQPKKSPAR